MRWCLLFYLFTCATAVAQTPVAIPIERLGRPFSPTNMQVNWRAQTNALPSSLWLYRASRSPIPSTVISNLMVLGSFVPQDRHQTENPQVFSFVDATSRRTLWINSEWSFVEYADQDATNIKIAEGVPDAKNVVTLGTNHLTKLGIDPDQLAKKPGTSELRSYLNDSVVTLYKGLGQPPYATNLYMRGVVFMRALDGVEFFGGAARGGCMFEFGHHAKISKIMIAWRHFEREKSYTVASPDTVLKWIHEGRAVWQPEADSIDWNSVKSLTITNATPYYFTETYGEFVKPRNTAFPFVALQASVETATTNTSVQIHCPILVAKKPSP